MQRLADHLLFQSTQIFSLLLEWKLVSMGKACRWHTMQVIHPIAESRWFNYQPVWYYQNYSICMMPGEFRNVTKKCCNPNSKKTNQEEPKPYTSWFVQIKHQHPVFSNILMRDYIWYEETTVCGQGFYLTLSSSKFTWKQVEVSHDGCCLCRTSLGNEELAHWTTPGSTELGFGISKISTQLERHTHCTPVSVKAEPFSLDPIASLWCVYTEVCIPTLLSMLMKQWHDEWDYTLAHLSEKLA